MTKALFLPTKGFVSEPVVLAHVGMGRTKWRELIAAGDAPPPLKLGPRMTRYSAESVHRWIDAKAAAQKAA